MSREEAIKYIEQHAFIDDEVKDMCIEALEKQIPKKPKESILGIYCSECKHFLSGTEYYCEFCGNGIDWGEEND